MHNNISIFLGLLVTDFDIYMLVFIYPVEGGWKDKILENISESSFPIAR